MGLQWAGSRGAGSMSKNVLRLLSSVKNKFYKDIEEGNLSIRIAVADSMTKELNINSAIEYSEANGGDILHVIVNVKESKGRIWVSFDCKALSKSLEGIAALKQRVALIRYYRSNK